MKTIDSLGIYWTFGSGEDKYQDEVDGIIFYGYWKTPFPKGILNNLDAFKQIWRNSDVEIKPRVWEGTGNCDLSIEIRIDKWPERLWASCIEKSLKWFVQLGADVAWCGGEYSSPSLDVFNYEESSGEIYGAYSCEAGFLCKSGLYEEYSALGMEELTKLKRAIE